MQGRIYEIDWLRGLGIILVVFFHMTWNICYEYNFTIIDEKWVLCLVYFFAGMLIFVSGASARLGKNTLKRGIIAFACGMLVTVITFIIFPDSYIKFGILHLLGVCMMAAWAIKKLKLPIALLLIMAGLLIVIGIYASGITIQNEYLFWLGFISENFISLDHYPIMPWMGIFILGFVFSSIFYKEKVSPFSKGKYKNNIFTFAGRHSLIIYLVHQPIVYVLIFYTPLKELLDKILR